MNQRHRTATGPARRCRPFTVLDAMLLVAATAVGCWLTPPTLSQWFHTLWLIRTNPMAAHYEGGSLAEASAGRLLLETLSRVAEQGLSVWLSWTVVVACFRLRRPRSTFRRLGAQPGWNGCSVAVVMAAGAIGWDGLAHLISHVVPTLTLRNFGSASWQSLACSLAGPAVVGCWVTQLLGGRWRPEPGWIDRSGFVLGWGWVVACTCRLVVGLFQFA